MAKKILIVDDEPNLVELVRINLASNGFEVMTATDGKEALKMLAAYSPDAIILDGRLPGMDGWEVCKIIKSDDKIKDIPVIFLSSATQKEDVRKAQEVGCRMFFAKPFDTVKLVEALKTILEV
jgi:DNA-binding response OmpR family regulator